MAKKRGDRSSSSTPRSSGSGSAGSTVLAFLLGAAAAGAAGYLFLHSSPKPIPAAAPPSSLSATPPPAKPSEHAAATTPRSAPFGISEDVFEAGAHLYAARCAGCHGTPAKDAGMTSPSIQLWRAGRNGGTSKSPADLYTGIANGNPGKGMPAYAHTLTDTQIWQLALLLQNAGQELPDPVVSILNAPSARAPTAASK